MKFAEQEAYSTHFLRKDQSGILFFTIMAVIFVTIFWGRFLLMPVSSTFDKPLNHKVVENGETFTELTGMGMIYGFWWFLMGISFVAGLGVSLYYFLILRDLKREQEISYLGAIIGWRRYQRDNFDAFSLAVAAIVVSLLVPTFSYLPIDLSSGTKLFAFYFLTFVLFSTYGLRNEILEKMWGEQIKKEEKSKQKKEKEKTEVSSNDQSTSSVPTIEQLLMSAMKEKEYQSLHFHQEVASIMQEIRLFHAYSEKITVEDVHLVERILKEEIPAVLATYDELDAEGKKEYYEDLKDCLERIQKKLLEQNKGKQEIKKLGAQKVIEILKKRY